MRGLTRRTFLKLAAAVALGPPRLPGPLPPDGESGDDEVPVLLYHGISNSIRDGYTVSPPSFSSQMEWLYEGGYCTLSPGDVEAFLRNGTRRAVVLTFDDGDTSFMDYAFPLLKVYGFRATVNIIGRAVDTNAVLDRGRVSISWDECRYLAASGLVDLGCHTYGLHRPGGVLTASYDELEKDLTLFQERFHRELGRTCTILAWPYGIYDRKCVEIAKRAGFTSFLTSREGIAGDDDNPDGLPRLAINDKLDLVSFEQYIGAAP